MRQIARWRGAHQAKADDAPAVGLALSGGGIRSATFNLGLLRALGRQERIPFIDYVSTVSGGGYVGAFLCSLFVPPEERGDEPEQAGEPAEYQVPPDPFASPAGRRGLDHLRQSGRHLLPGGAGDAVRLFAIALRNFLALHFVIGVSLFATFIATKPLKAWLVNAGWLRRWEAAHLAPAFPPWLWPSQWLQGFPLHHMFIGSGLWLLAAIWLAVTSVLGAAFFLTRRSGRLWQPRLTRVASASGLFAGGVIALGIVLLRGTALMQVVGVLALWLGVGSLIAYFAAHAVDAWSRDDDPAPRAPLLQEDRVRHLLSNWQGAWMFGTVAFALLGLFDALAQTIYLHSQELASRAAQAAGAVGIGAWLGRQALNYFAGTGANSRVGETIARFGRLIALLLGLLLALLVATTWAVAAHSLAWRGRPIGDPTDWGGSFNLLLVAAAVWVAGMALGRCWGFINLSSFSSFYAGRLRRAYLGASNPNRPVEMPVNAQHVDDEIRLDRYYGPQVAGPVHLINATVNDTVGRSSNLTRTDRRGSPLVVAPAGLLYQDSAGADGLAVIEHPASADRAEGEARPAENLPLSVWTAISGAAFSTGMGQNSSLGLSLIAGLANLRLGYWWDSATPITGGLLQRRLGKYLQINLLGEFTGRFAGTGGQRWYLSDGGHFENMGVYELVRRRVPLIIAADCGADPLYQFVDLTRMMRMIRTDLKADLRFLEAEQLDTALGRGAVRQLFGTVAELTGAAWDRAATADGPYAALGEISYADAPDARSTFLLIKPRLTGSEPPDMLAFARKYRDFPQQTTADQFFGEEQWDAYYRLGEWIGGKLFAPAEEPAAWRWFGRPRWHPHAMRPMPPVMPA